MDKHTNDKSTSSPRLFDALLPFAVGFAIMITAIANIGNFINSAESNLSHVESGELTLKQALSKVESSYAAGFAAKNNYVDLNGAFATAIDQDYLNDIIKSESGMLMQTIDEQNLEPQAQRILELHDYLQMRDVDMMYVQLPRNYLTDDDPALPDWAQTYANQNADGMLAALNNAGLATMDIREHMIEQDVDANKMFFRTDHHWTQMGALWSHTYYMDVIDNVLGRSIDINEKALDFGNYNYTTYEDLFLGSTGQRVGTFYTGGDDFTLITPNFETDMTFEIPVLGHSKRGTYEQVTVDPLDVIDYEKSFNSSVYGPMSLANDYDYMSLTNHLAENDLKIFIIKDSFSLAIAPFLALHYNEIHLYDIRLADSQEILDAIDEEQPDLVIVQYFSGFFADKDAFKFLTEEAEQEVYEYRESLHE